MEKGDGLSMDKMDMIMSGFLLLSPRAFFVRGNRGVPSLPHLIIGLSFCVEE